ncbi:MAG: hypothetical protein WCP17_02790 [bacterium]
MYFVADLPSKKLSLQKIFGLNLHLKSRHVFGNPFKHYASLREARENFAKNDLSLILAGLLNEARTYFIKNSTEALNVNADSVLRKHFLGKRISQNLG